jgi:hypothetical protein
MTFHIQRIGVDLMFDNRILKLFEGLGSNKLAASGSQDAQGIASVLALRVKKENFIILHG